MKQAEVCTNSKPIRMCSVLACCTAKQGHKIEACASFPPSLDFRGIHVHSTSSLPADAGRGVALPRHFCFLGAVM
eukprot:1159947-Pelagomonas_calceolata.AAC.1